MRTFRVDVEALRQGASRELGEGPVTPAYTADAPAVIDVLNELLATEIVSCLQYAQHSTVVAGPLHQSVGATFRAYARGSLRNISDVSSRIDQLGGTPDLNPAGLSSRSYTSYRGSLNG